MQAYYFKIDVIPESLPPFSREARVLANSSDNAMYILDKAVWENFCTHFRIVRQQVDGLDDYSAGLIGESNGYEGYYQFTAREVTIDLLLPFVPVNHRVDFIDTFIADL